MLLLMQYLYANGRDGEYSETEYLLSKTVHSFTHELKSSGERRRGGGGEGVLPKSLKSGSAHHRLEACGPSNGRHKIA